MFQAEFMHTTGITDSVSLRCLWIAFKFALLYSHIFLDSKVGLFGECVVGEPWCNNGQTFTRLEAWCRRSSWQMVRLYQGVSSIYIMVWPGSGYDKRCVIPCHCKQLLDKYSANASKISLVSWRKKKYLEKLYNNQQTADLVILCIGLLKKKKQLIINY